MKIRTDFVTNSSSSCFTVEITVFTPSGCVSIGENPFNYNPDYGGTAKFADDLRNINSHLSSVEELAGWLANSIERDYQIDSENVAFKKRCFVEEVCKQTNDVRDIEKITVERRYYASGEFAELVADNDEMEKLARAYLNSTGIEKERAKAEMVTYIHTATDARGEFFGENSMVNRYRWDGKSVRKLAQRLCSMNGPSSVSGVERKELNLKTGEYFDVSEFDLR